MRIWMSFIVFLMITTGCSSQDFVGSTTGRSDSNKKALNMSGKLIGSREETRIVVSIPGDTIIDVQFATEIYTVTLALRPIQIIDFYNHQSKLKTLILINFTEKSEVLMYDVVFSDKKNIALIKYRTTDKENNFIEQPYIP